MYHKLKSDNNSLATLNIIELFLLTDIDECSLSQDNCHENADCANTEGSFECSCLQGFQGDGQTCLRKLS